MHPLFIIVIPTLLFVTTWETFIGAVPYGLKYGILSTVFCLAAILIKELGLGKVGGSIRMSINKYTLSFIFSTSLTWLAGTFLGASVDINYVIAGAVGLTIEFSAPWFQTKAFVWLKKVFKS